MKSEKEIERRLEEYQNLLAGSSALEFLEAEGYAIERCIKELKWVLEKITGTQGVNS